MPTLPVCAGCRNEKHKNTPALSFFEKTVGSTFDP
jgi:hypothetical protein